MEYTTSLLFLLSGRFQGSSTVMSLRSLFNKNDKHQVNQHSLSTRGMLHEGVTLKHTMNNRNYSSTDCTTPAPRSKITASHAPVLPELDFPPRLDSFNNTPWPTDGSLLVQSGRLPLPRTASSSSMPMLPAQEVPLIPDDPDPKRKRFTIAQDRMTERYQKLVSSDSRILSLFQDSHHSQASDEEEDSWYPPEESAPSRVQDMKCTPVCELVDYPMVISQASCHSCAALVETDFE